MERLLEDAELTVDDMMGAYEQRREYLGMFIGRTGNPTIDHVIPKSLAWDRVTSGRTIGCAPAS